MKSEKSLEPGVFDKAIVCGTSFACASAAFVLAAIFLIPVVGTVLHSIEPPEWIQQVVILVTLFGTPIVAAFVGLGIGTRLINSSIHPNDLIAADER